MTKVYSEDDLRAKQWLAITHTDLSDPAKTRLQWQQLLDRSTELKNSRDLDGRNTSELEDLIMWVYRNHISAIVTDYTQREQQWIRDNIQINPAEPETFEELLRHLRAQTAALIEENSAPTGDSRATVIRFGNTIREMMETIDVFGGWVIELTKQIRALNGQNTALNEQNRVLNEQNRVLNNQIFALFRLSRPRIQLQAAPSAE